MDSNGSSRTFYESLKENPQGMQAENLSSCMKGENGMGKEEQPCHLGWCIGQPRRRK